MQQKIIEIIARVLEVDLDEVTLDTEIGELPEWDSMHHIHIISELENEFGCKLPEEELMDLEDVSDIVSLIKEKVG